MANDYNSVPTYLATQGIDIEYIMCYRLIRENKKPEMPLYRIGVDRNVDVGTLR